MPRVVAPTEDSAAGDWARRLAHALGTALQASDGTAAAADLLALGGALAAAASRREALTDEAFVDGASYLLAEYERAYGLPVDASLGKTARRARLVAKVRAARAGSPQAILRAVHALDPTATLHENKAATIPQPSEPGYEDTTAPTPRAGDKRLVFLFAVRLAAATWADESLRARIDALCDQMQPAHAAHSLHTNDPADGFRFGVDAFGSGAWFAV